MRNIVFVFTLAVLASGCGAPSVEDLADDPERLSRILVECAREHPLGIGLSEKCQNAQKAMFKLNQQMVDDMMN